MRHTEPETVVRLLRDAEAELAGGNTVARVGRKLGVSEQTYYRWRAGRRYAGDAAERLPIAFDSPHRHPAVRLGGMSDVTRLMEAARAGDRVAAAELLPLVYDELRALAAVRMAAEAPGHTLDATALVHEAYLRLVGDQQFDSRGHFFAAAAEAMRRILVDSARRRAAAKRGGELVRVPLPDELAADGPDSDPLGVHEVVDQLEAHDPRSAGLVKLHVFAGLPLERAAEVLGISPRVAYRDWAFARAWMYRRLGGV